MNKVLVPKVVFKDIIADESRIKMAYARLFEIARKNLLIKKQLKNCISGVYSKA